jgi:hypothetical protein
MAGILTSPLFGQNLNSKGVTSMAQFDQTSDNSLSIWWDTYVGSKNRRRFAERKGFTPFETDTLAACNWVDVPPEWKHRLLTH